MVEHALRQAAVALGNVELFAVANGPGSFTGIRVGVAAMQAWGRAFKRPVRGVSVLEALIQEAGPETEWAVSILDAHRGEFFVGLFQRCRSEVAHDCPYQAEGKGWVLKPHEVGPLLQQQLPTGAVVTCVAREHDQATLALREPLPYNWQWVPGILVGSIARRALFAYRQNSQESPGQLDASYIRRPDAELNWRD
jgi:tRNA threonylcarbamoyladenosine biosynthesis protein TsaB